MLTGADTIDWENCQHKQNTRNGVNTNETQI